MSFLINYMMIESGVLGQDQDWGEKKWFSGLGCFGFLEGSWGLTGRSRRKRRGIKVTKGDLNRLIDDIFHRHFSENVGFVIVDGLLHAVVERNPDESIRKFVRFNVPVLVREMARKRRVKGRRRKEKESS